jgi:phage tail-like protein
MQKFLFTVHDASGGFQTSKFQKATGIETTIGVAEYSEGGSFAPYKEPGRFSYGNVTLELGVSEDMSFYNWVVEVGDMLAHMPEGAGSLTLDMLRDFFILQRDRTQTPRIQHDLVATFPCRYNPGEWDNTVDDVQLSELELCQWYNTQAIA